MTAAFTPCWIVVYRDQGEPRQPDADAQVFVDEAAMVEQVACHANRCCSHSVIEALHIAKDGTVTRIRDDLDRLCREYLDDWDAEIAHRQDLRWARL